MTETGKELVLRPAGEKPNRFFRFSRCFVRPFFKWYNRAELEGAENLPATGPCLILSNHASYLDPPLIGGLLDRDVHSLGRDGLFRVPILGAMIRGYDCHPIRREGVDREAIKTCVAVLKAGYPLLLFPEGTRSADGKTTKPRGGFGMIVEQVPEVPCVPVLVRGTERALGRGKIFPRPAKVRMSVGEPFIVGPRGEAESRRDYIQKCADQLEAQWRKLGAVMKTVEDMG